MSDIQNTIQQLTPDQQKRTYFAIVATGLTMADGTRQNNQSAMVRFRDGSMHYVKDLPVISNSNPQPNGDYQVDVTNDHDDTVESQAGVGWLFLDAQNRLHMCYTLSTNPAANAIRPLAEDRMLEFSTEGFLKNMSDDGTYGDFWITGVSPVRTGNDPGTQSVTNKIKEKSMAEQTLSKEDVTNMIQNALKKNDDQKPTDILSTVGDMITKLGITDTQWIADITADILKATSGKPYDEDDSKPEETDDPQINPTNTPDAEAENTVKNKVMTAGDFKPTVHQAIVSEDDTLKKNSPEYVEAWGRHLLAKATGNRDYDKPYADILRRNDVTFDPDSVSLVPELVTTRVTELLQSSNNILSHITMNTGFPYYNVPAYVSQTSYAKGRARGNVAQKESQTATIKARTIYPQSIYKYVTLPADLVENNGGTTGSGIVDWVTRELPAKVIRAMEEALIVGGVKNDDSGSTPYTAVHSITDDVTASGSAYGEVYTPAAGETFLQSLSNAVPKVDLLDTTPNGTGIYLIISRTDFRELLNAAMLGDGKYPANLAGNANQIASFLGIDGVIEVPWLRPASREANQNPNIATWLQTYRALLVNLSAVQGVGELTPTSLSQFYLRANSYDFESRVRFGAALGAPWSAVLLKRDTASTSGN